MVLPYPMTTSNAFGQSACIRLSGGGGRTKVLSPKILAELDRTLRLLTEDNRVSATDADLILLHTRKGADPFTTKPMRGAYLRAASIMRMKPSRAVFFIRKLDRNIPFQLTQEAVEPGSPEVYALFDSFLEVFCMFIILTLPT